MRGSIGHFMYSVKSSKEKKKSAEIESAVHTNNLQAEFNEKELEKRKRGKSID